jgi:hypothetical protein
LVEGMASSIGQRARFPQAGNPKRGFETSESKGSVPPGWPMTPQRRALAGPSRQSGSLTGRVPFDSIGAAPVPHRPSVPQDLPEPPP